MIHFTQDDAQMLAHVVDVVGDRMHSEDGYTDTDRATMTKLEALVKEGAAVVVSGKDGQANVVELNLFLKIVRAELDHWVPNASQRLLFRAGAALGVQQPDPSRMSADCGPDRHQHALVADWVSTMYVYRCASCVRLYRA